VFAIQVTEDGRLRTPIAAFSSDDVGWNTDRGPRRLRPLLPHLTGFEMVVASMNNGAIDNIAEEVPQMRAIDEMWAGQSDYFAEHESRLLDAPAWALIAAPLGNKSNRERFADRFWWGRTADAKAPAQPGFLDWLKKIDISDAVRRWPRAVEEFSTAPRIQETLRDARQRGHEALRGLPGKERALVPLARRPRTAPGSRHRGVRGRHRRDPAGAGRPADRERQRTTCTR
jgi:hypothetical protein